MQDLHFTTSLVTRYKRLVDVPSLHRSYFDTKSVHVRPVLDEALFGHFSMYVCRFRNAVLRCPTPRLHCFLSSHWPSFRFLSFMVFLIPSIQFFFGPLRALFCFGIHYNAILDNLPSAILWTWPYHVSWFCSIPFIIGSSSPICCLIVTFLILSFLSFLDFKKYPL